MAEEKKNQSNEFLQKFAVFIIASALLYFFLITFVPIPETGVRFADTILGALIGSGFTAILSFYWGSSKGSADKNDSIEKMAGNRSETDT